MSLSLKPTHKPVKDYYAALDAFAKHDITHETAVRNAFQQLLTYCSRKVGWQFIEERQWTPKGTSRTLFVDGVMEDKYNLPRAWWEAKDEQDDLAKEAKKKFEIGYPDENIIFQSPARAILYQKKRKILDEDITSPKMLVEVIHELFNYREDWVVDWETAADDFKDRIPQYADALMKLIERERKDNTQFIERFSAFADLCKATINPNLRDEAIEEMLIQHMLTKRIFTSVFSNTAFTRRNPVAREITGVVDALTSRSFSEAEFFADLERFYKAIERGAENISEYATKQHFLNNVYERFFQGFSVKVADTHGIVYTPQPIVDFMVRSVDEILKKEFGKKEGLGAKGVHILDPFVGTGNFMMRVMREIPKTMLEYKYAHELHCNEVMLLPYYIASMNIEHEYYELTGSYRPFEGICLVDTFELDEPTQGVTDEYLPENTERILKQNRSPIFVVIGNPPYNASQVNENDNNKNRKYPVVDNSVAKSYSKASAATNKNALSDVYVKAFRWASNRIKKAGQGVVAFVSNNSFINEIAFDGMRKQLVSDFNSLYILNLRGNVRKNPKIAGTTHNVFGIQVGVSINLLVKEKNNTNSGKVYYADTDEFWRKAERYRFLGNAGQLTGVEWRELTPDKKGTWLTSGLEAGYSQLPILGSSEGKSGNVNSVIFSNYGRGVATCRDAWTYNCSSSNLEHNVIETIDIYNHQTFKWSRDTVDSKLDEYYVYDDTKISWSEGLKNFLKRGIFIDFDTKQIRRALYRPFFSEYLYFDKHLNERRYQLPAAFPTHESDNVSICVSAVGNTKPFHCLITNVIPDLHLTGDSQCFPFYTYDPDGSNRTENITDWALGEYRRRYPSAALRAGGGEVEKWDIFYYIYGILHSPEYREKYAANLRRELPRIPYVKSAEDFWAFSEAGRRLAFLHLNYDVTEKSELIGAHPLPVGGDNRGGRSPSEMKSVEESPRLDAEDSARRADPLARSFGPQGGEVIEEYPLQHIETPDTPLDWRVEKMRWKDKKEKTILVYNNFLTLAGIPPEAHRYKLGNRSALDWIVDQYRVKTDKRSGITNDPNRPDDPQYIVRLIKKIVTVSLETMKVVDGLPMLDVEE
ncbi:MAG: DNA helicase [Ectothiorhodospiraceae bacterium]|nr:DNA helicase [Ectothiorhodospiraceae bacterium]